MLQPTGVPPNYATKAEKEVLVATDVEFNYKSTHVINFNGGYVSYYPAIPQDARLYVIYNDSTDRHVYVGTATNVQNRFNPRIEALREFGFSEDQLKKIFIMIVQIKIDGYNKPPDNYGKAGDNPEIDVEHLLVRTYVEKLNVNARNIDKASKKFKNETGGKLTWSLVNNAGIQNFGVHNYGLDTGKSL